MPSNHFKQRLAISVLTFVLASGVLTVAIGPVAVGPVATGEETTKFSTPKIRPVGPTSPAAPSADKAAKSSDPARPNEKARLASRDSAANKTRPRATVTRGKETLPNDKGQIWQEYDLKPYTSKITNNNRPEQAVIDWVLRETGTELWFTEPLGVLNASRDTLRVYHTPDVQQIVADVVDRFIASEGEQHVLGLQLVTVGNPNWRSKAISVMQPVTVQSPGIEAWLMSRENGALLLADLRKRTDFREHNAPNLVIHNGQSQTITRAQQKTYPRTLKAREAGLPGMEVVNGQIDEGFSLQVSSLLSLDNRSLDAVIRCQIDQIEKMVPVSIDVPGFGTAKQTFQLQVPQLVSWRLHERFRWPADQVLLLSCGVVATPAPERGGFKAFSFGGGTNRADALMFVEYRGPANHVLLNNSKTAANPGALSPVVPTIVK